MVSFKSTVPAAAIVLLATSVTAQNLENEILEARNPLRHAAGQIGRQAMRSARPVARAGAHAFRPPASKPPITGKQLGTGMVIGKIAGGLTVGFGAVGAQAIDEKIGKREEEDMLYARNPLRTAGTRLVSQATRQAMRPGAAARVIRPVRAAVPHPHPPSHPPSSIASKLKSGLATGGVALAAGVGEYKGGKDMGIAAGRLGRREILTDALEELVARYFPDLDEVEARDFAEDYLEQRDLEEEELFARNPGLRMATGALRAAARRPPTHVVSKFGGAARTFAKGAGIAGAAGVGGYAEGSVQSMGPDTFRRLSKDPKGTLNIMYPKKPRDLEEMEIRDLLDSLHDELD